MSISFDNCGICNLRHIWKLSVNWCSDCDEGLCQDCSGHHSLSKLSRNHSVVPIAENKKLPSFVENIKLHCDEHDEKYLLFCKEHNECVCRKCVITEKHGECKEMIPIEDVIKNSKTSAAFTEIESSLHELKANFGLILENRQKNLCSFSASKNLIESEISAIRKQINHHLDLVQDNVKAELNKAVENSTKKIQIVIASLKKHQIEIEKCIEDLENIKKHATDMQTFLGTAQLDIKLRKQEKDLQDLVDGGTLAHTVVSSQLNPLLQNIHKHMTSFGKIIIDVIPFQLSLRRSKQSQAQMMKVMGKPKCSVENITLELKIKFKTKAFNVSGCCILPSGKLVVSNNCPSHLTLFSPDGKINRKINCDLPYIYDVACVDDTTVAVVSMTMENIELIDMESGKTFTIVRTYSPCCGLTYKNNHFIVSPQKGQIQEIRIDDTKTYGIGSSMSSLHLAALGNKLYSRKRDTNTIVCHNKNGDVLWTYTDTSVLNVPRGITVDEYGNIFVVGNKSKNVVAISSHGRGHKILLSEKDLCGSPWALCYSNN
ncbi:uncharacterized protein [Mytilus edulis]|uniref:uncharacterized protein n=1 Tax=Mytilus edulis TaxID=6550 RepID=UPI0039EE98A8